MTLRPDIERWLHHADAMRLVGNYEAAIDALKRVLAAEPDHAVGHAMMALSLLGRRRLWAAQHEAALALVGDADEPLCHYAMAAVLIARRDHSGAAAHLDVLLALEPDAPANHRLMAELHDDSGRAADALASLEHALALDGDDVHTLVALAELALEHGRCDEAAAYTADVLAIDPEHLGAHVVRGHLDLIDGDPAAAREHAVFVLGEAPEHIGGINLLAAIKARESFTLGLWWRFASRLSRMGNTQMIAWLLAMYLGYQLAFILADELGAESLATVFRIAWLGFCAYTWVGPGLIRRMIDRELDTVELSEDY